jgi:stigma-specific protein Stig1
MLFVLAMSCTIGRNIMRTRFLTLAFGLALGATSCVAAGPSVEQMTEALVSDAMNNGGTAGFYFLPPIVSDPALIGTFDAALSPIVRIDQMSPTGTPLKTIATYTTTSGPGYETVRLDPSGPNYILNWHTKRFNLDPGTYRVNVLLETREIGFIDVEVVSDGRSKHGHSGPCAAVLNGSTLPIKFWMNTCVPIVCTALDQCHTAGICDPSTTLCSNPIASDGATCDDGDACTAGDACSGGVCQRGPINVCCPPPTVNIAGVYRGTATISTYATSASYTISGPPACTELFRRGATPAVLDVEGPPYAVSLEVTSPPPNTLILDLVSQPDFTDAVWDLSGLVLTHHLSCIQNYRWQDEGATTITIDPAAQTATLYAECEVDVRRHDACGFASDAATEWSMVLPLSCVRNQTVNVRGWAVTCDANGTITSSVPCTRPPGPSCAPPQPDACGVGTSQFCTDLQTDLDNCGQCGNACPFWAGCAQGACYPPPSCAPGTCGDCGNVCAFWETCSDGQCAEPCVEPTPDGCGSSFGGPPQYCTDLSTDSANCGTCLRACSEGEICQGGGCVCANGYPGPPCF